MTSVPGVSCVLNGIRKTEYVEDSLAVLGWKALPEARQVFERLRGQ